MPDNNSTTSTRLQPFTLGNRSAPTWERPFADSSIPNQLRMLDDGCKFALCRGKPVDATFSVRYLSKNRLVQESAEADDDCADCAKARIHGTECAAHSASTHTSNRSPRSRSAAVDEAAAEVLRREFSHLLRIAVRASLV